MDKAVGNTMQEAISNARRWLKRARLDYDGFEKIIGKQYLQNKNIRPHDPALSLYLLQQAIEKTVKSIAVASGSFKEEDLVREYQHHTLKLYLDFSLKLLDLPLAQVLAFMPGFNQPKIDEARIKLDEIKKNTLGTKRRPVQAPDWWVEYATLPPDAVERMLSILINIRKGMVTVIHKNVSGRSRLNIAVIESYSNNPTTTNLKDLLSPMLRVNDLEESYFNIAEKIIKQVSGNDFSKLLKEVLNKERESLVTPSIRIKREDLDSVFLPAWAVAALSVLSALTFPHESSVRYPSFGPMSETKLDCERYTEKLGVVAHIREVGYVTKMVLADMESVLEPIALTFSQYTKHSRYVN